MATPALSQGLMYVRTSRHLFAISQSVASAPGTERIGRVRIDEGHHNYHTSTGSYAAYARLLGWHDFSVASSRGPVTRDELAKTNLFISASALPEPYDTLVRKAKDAGEPFEWSAAASRPAYSAEEIATIREWVRVGGSLLLVVDHAPFGRSGGELAAAFGVEVRNTITTDSALTTTTEFLNRPGHLLFSRRDGRLGDHPTLTGVDSVVTYTGTSLTAPSGAAVLLRLPDTAVDRTWNPARKATDPVPAVGRAQAVALEYGAGRVVVLGEAGMLTTDPGSNADNCGDRGIALADTGNRRFGLNIARWLARKSVDVDPSSFANTGCVAPPRLTFVITGPDAEHAAFTGTWKADVSRGQSAMTVNLRLERNRVSGELVFAQTVKIQTGTVAGDRISFTVPSPNGQRVITFTGTLRGDEIAWTRTVQIKEGGAPGGPGLFGMGGPPAFVAVRAK